MLRVGVLWLGGVDVVRVGGCCCMSEWMHIDTWMIMVHVRVSGVLIVACGCRVVEHGTRVCLCYGFVWVGCVGAYYMCRVVSVCVHDGNHLI